MTRRQLLALGGVSAAGLATAALGCRKRDREAAAAAPAAESGSAEPSAAVGGARSAARAPGDVARPADTAGSPDASSQDAARVPRRVLGKTGREIPILAVGGSMLWNQKFDPKLPEALRFGADYFDSARNYEGSETALGSFHTRAGVRDQIWITSKSKRHDPAGLEQTLGESLTRLQTDHVEMYFLHALRDAKVLSRDLERTVARLKKTGRIHFFGFSCHHGNVAELLQVAAELDWIDAVMFRYNFRQYGDRELNRAIDAAHAAGVGLIAMKTQGSEASFRDAWKRFTETGKWNKYQAVLKAVWEDERITAAVSEMDSFDKLRENLAAAMDRGKLSGREREAIERYARDTRGLACDGCDHLCGAHVDAPVRIADTMRYLMYHDVYGKPERARALFRSQPEAAQALAAVDFREAERACPHGVAICSHMRRAAALFSG